MSSRDFLTGVTKFTANRPAIMPPVFRSSTDHHPCPYSFNQNEPDRKQKLWTWLGKQQTNDTQYTANSSTTKGQTSRKTAEEKVIST